MRTPEPCNAHTAEWAIPRFRPGTHPEFQNECLNFPAGLQETSRAVRKEDSPVNSVIGGAGAAYLLVSLHREELITALGYCVFAFVVQDCNATVV